MKSKFNQQVLRYQQKSTTTSHIKRLNTKMTKTQIDGNPSYERKYELKCDGFQQVNRITSLPGEIIVCIYGPCREI
jgi:hypothetical protein